MKSFWRFFIQNVFVNRLKEKDVAVADITMDNVSLLIKNLQCWVNRNQYKTYAEGKIYTLITISLKAEISSHLVRNCKI